MQVGAIRVTMMGLLRPPPETGKLPHRFVKHLIRVLCMCMCVCIFGVFRLIYKGRAELSTQGVVSSPGLLSAAFLWDSQSKPSWRSLCWKKATECQAFSELEKGVFQTAAVCERVSELLSCPPRLPRPTGVRVRFKDSSGL